MSSTRMLAVLLASMIIASTVSCGGGDDGGTGKNADKDTPAASIAPERDDRAVETTIPVYSGDPEATRRPRGQGVLDDLPRVRPTELTNSPAFVDSHGKTVGQWLDAVSEDVATFWQAAFNSAHRQFEPVRRVIFSSPVKDCIGAMIDVDIGARYCRIAPYSTSRDAIYLALPWFEREINPIGDAATAIVVAHEFGHRIQHLLGTVSRYPILDIELQADCFAGYWTASKFTRGDLELPGDVTEAKNVAGKYPSKTHGTSEQRVAAFLAGYNDGRGSKCKISELRALRQG